MHFVFVSLFMPVVRRACPHYVKNMSVHKYPLNRNSTFLRVLSYTAVTYLIWIAVSLFFALSNYAVNSESFWQL